MKLESLNCNHCGAPLEVPETANFVTCNHCEAKLAIRRTASTTFTEQLGQIEAKQDRLLEKVTSLQRQNRLAQIDRQWDRDREKLLIADKHGNRHEPNATMAVMGGVVVVVFGLFWTVTAANLESRSPLGGSPFPVPFALFGVIFIFVGLATAVYQFTKAGDFRAAKRRYQRARQAAIRDNDQPDHRNPSELLADLDHIPTPGEYLAQLSEEDARLD